jgi:hypothetical protein
MPDEDLIVIPLPLSGGGITYGVARLVLDGERPFAEAIVAIPGTRVRPAGPDPAVAPRHREGPAGIGGAPGPLRLRRMILPPPGDRGT